MDDSDDIRARLVEIETAIALQGETLRELSDNAAEQWKAIDALARRVEEIADRLSSVEDRDGPGSEEPPPPHY